MKVVRIGARPMLAAAIVGLGAVLAACGGGGDSDNGGQPTVPLQNAAATAAPTPVPDTVVIKVTDNAFTPAEVTVKKGTIVVWEWEGTTNPHSIQMQGTTSPEQTSGTFERIMDQPGVSLAYQCGVHKAEMTGRIIVE